MSKILSLFVDGGVIGSNPSMIGGTYAYRLIFEDGSNAGRGNVITPTEIGGPVTNNQTEMLAMLEGLKRLPDYWTGTIYSDSAVTLGRVFSGWKWKNIPTWMHQLYKEQRARLTCWSDIKYVQLDGHPTKAQLLSGIGKRGNPVSEHNVWCDQACTEAGETFMAGIAKNIPSAIEMVQA